MKTCRYLRGRQAEFCSKSKAASVNAFAAFLSPSLWITCGYGGSPKVLIKIKSSSNLSSLGSSISCRLGLGCHHSLHFPGQANVLDLNSDGERKCAFLSYLSTWGHGFPICQWPAPDRRLAALRSAPWVSMLKNLCELKLTSRKAFRRGCSFPGRSFCECVRLHHDMITSDDLSLIHENFGFRTWAWCGQAWAWSACSSCCCTPPPTGWTPSCNCFAKYERVHIVIYE